MDKYIDQRFWLPLIAVLLGGIMVFTNYLPGEVWAYLTMTIVTGFMGLAGWSNQVSTSATIAKIQADLKTAQYK